MIAWRPTGIRRSLEPLPRARTTPGAQVDAADRQVDGLARAQPAGVHELEHGAVAQRGGLVAARRREQLGDLVAGEHLRQLLALARRAQLGRRVVGDDLLAPQVAVERAQAGGLALDRRGRDGRALRAAGRQLGEKAGELGVAERRRVEAVAREEVAELQQVGAVGLQRVARQAALELEVGEEVEHVVLERARGGCWAGDGHAGPGSPRAARFIPVQRGVRGVASQRWRSHCRPMTVLASFVAASAASRSASGQRTISIRSPGSGFGVARAQPGRREEVDELVGVAAGGAVGAHDAPSARPRGRSPRRARAGRSAAATRPRRRACRRAARACTGGSPRAAGARARRARRRRRRRPRRPSGARSRARPPRRRRGGSARRAR